MKSIGIISQEERDNERFYYDNSGKIYNTSFPTYISGIIHGHGTLVENKMNKQIDICEECYHKIMRILVESRSDE
jgi:hypothetical protein